MKLAEGIDAAVFMQNANGGVGYSIEHGGFHHGVVGHVIEDEHIADAQGTGKCVVARDISSETGRAAEAVGVRGAAAFFC